MGDTFCVRSRARSCADSDELEVALQRLCAKLKASQPVFTEEDVALIPFLSDNSSFPTRPLSNSDGVASMCEVEDLTFGQIDLGKNGEMYGLQFDVIKEPAEKCLSSSSHLGSTNSCSIDTASSDTINLDNPLSVGLFLTAVNVFEPKLITKNKKVALDAVKLVKQGYALTYRDPHFVFPSESKIKTRSTVSDSIAVMLVKERMNPKRRPIARPSCVVNTLSSPQPSYKPDPALILYLDQSIRALLVYCNDSTPLAQFISSNQSILRLFGFVCSMARRAEEGAVDGAERSLGTRDVNVELEELRSLWNSCGLVGRVVNYLQECYLIEFLLDDALPPAVCSSRYEGLINALNDKKHKITVDMLMSRHEFSNMIRMTPLKGLVGIVKMSAFTAVKQQARLLDRITAEGLMERLLEELKDVCQDLFSPLGSVCDIDCSSLCSPTASSRTPSNTPVHSQIERNGSSSRRKISTSLSVSGSQTQNGLGLSGRALECLGYCADIILLVTSPNLQPALEVDEMAKSSRTAPAAVVRSTLWASQESTLREMLALLLRIACCTFQKNQQHSFVHLKLHITDCVLQIAAYSGCLYSMVVDVINALFEDFQYREKLCGSRCSPSHPTLTVGSTRSSEPTTIHAFNDLKYLEIFIPLLPFLVGLLAQTNHAQVHAVSIRRWFWYLSENLIPDAFEAPSLINGRKSTATWGRLLMKRLKPATKGLMEENMCPWRVSMLARDLKRREVISLLPYFTFACRVIRETVWRDGSKAFFEKIASLSYHVVMTNAWQRSLCFGQAFCCYDLVSIILSQPDMRLLKDTDMEGGGEMINNTSVKESPQVSKNTSNESCDIKKRSRSVVAAEDKSLQFFILSPKHGSVFHEAWSPTLTDSEFQDCIESNDLITDLDHSRSVSLCRDNDGAHEVVEEPGDISPKGVLTQPWHLSRRVLLLPNSSLNSSTADS
ncbi:unnamed protein product [Phytomonas sp. EM1]|nr:unnamed protein product [Phytomonas sp. EM1]|eukprot:CCW60335.1 unnamed protein product [Phytomonas sp. isolate EM1]